MSHHQVMNISLLHANFMRISVLYIQCIGQHSLHLVRTSHYYNTLLQSPYHLAGNSLDTFL